MKSFSRFIIGLFLLAGGVSGNAYAADCGDQRIVGAWEVEAVGAPYQPHLFIFHADGTMITTNPTNVQESPTKKHGGTNDSLGMGSWECISDGTPAIVGTFLQLNANADDHSPASTLSVTFKVIASASSFSGNAAVKIGEIPAPRAKLVGRRITTDTAALEKL